MMINDNENVHNATAILQAGTALARPHKSPPNDGVPSVAVREGFKIEHVFERDKNPLRATDVVKLSVANGFVTYFKRQKRPESLIYASLDPAKILDVIDDHRAYDTDSRMTTARIGAHTGLNLQCRRRANGKRGRRKTGSR